MENTFSLLVKFKVLSLDIFIWRAFGVLLINPFSAWSLICHLILLKKYKQKQPPEPPATTLFKKRLWHRCFPVNFVKFLRTHFFIEQLWWLLLYYRPYLYLRFASFKENNPSLEVVWWTRILDKFDNSFCVIRYLRKSIQEWTK